MAGLFARLGVAVVYTLLYGLMSIIVSGSGHGSSSFVAPLFTWIFYLTALIGLSKLSNRAFLVLMLLHYVFVPLLVWDFIRNGVDPNEAAYWERYSGLVIFTIVVYASGQIVAWGSFLYKNHSKQIDEFFNF